MKKLTDKQKISNVLLLLGIEIKSTPKSLSWEDKKFFFNDDGTLKYIQSKDEKYDNGEQ